MHTVKVKIGDDVISEGVIIDDDCRVIICADGMVCTNCQHAPVGSGVDFTALSGDPWSQLERPLKIIARTGSAQ